MVDSKSTKSITKTEFVQQISDESGVARKEVGQVLSAMEKVIGTQLSKKGPGMVAIPGLMKVTKIEKPATPERKGINPFTKQEQVFKAKPARNVVKVRPLKKLKEMVS